MLKNKIMNTLKRWIKISIIGIMSWAVFIATPSCEEVARILADSTASDLSGLVLGWIGTDEKIDELESDIYLGPTDKNNDLPKVNLSKYLPPIGDQGMYGTCVAWALGYNMRTFLNAVEKDLSASQLASASNQFSPKDLFLSIDESKKGKKCNGTGFEHAFDIMVSRGVARMSTVPYSNLGGCVGSPKSSWTSEAKQYKIENYRKIDYKTEVVKKYLANGRLVAIGARLGDNFMKWNDEQIISSDTYNNPGMQHAYHAMVVSGYDDNKRAFRVVNSWSSRWGDKGYVWVDYDFFENNFCFAAFVAAGPQANPDTDGNNTVDDDYKNKDYDLVGTALKDLDDEDYKDPKERLIRYNVLNSGEKEIKTSKDWSILYLYYNAYDANDYGIIIYDYYTDDYGGKQGDNGEITNPANKMGSSSNYWNYLDVPAGKSVAQAAGFYAFEFQYTMPNITGKYFLTLIADGFDVIHESDETNNFVYFAQKNGDPLTIKNGVIQNSIAKADYVPIIRHSMVSKENVNTYKPTEIEALIKHQLKTGELQRKAKSFIPHKKNVKRGVRK